MKDEITKDQVYGLRSYRASTVKLLWALMLVSIWFKVGLNSNWHLNDIMVELLSLFVLTVNGIVGNIKNNFPIFKMRNFNLTKEFAYSITSFFVLLFVFVIYQNIVCPKFIADIAALSFHDLCTMLVFLFPIACLTIYLIYFSYKLIYKDKSKKVFEKYDNKTERSLNRYKVFSIKIIFLIMLFSLWGKVGVYGNYTFASIFTEVYTIFTIAIMYLVGNADNKLPLLHNFHFKIDRYFFYSMLLPYVLMLIYALFSSNFRMMITMLDVKEIISMLVLLAPLFFISSFIFYIGCRYPNFISDKVKKNKKSKSKVNAIISVIISFLVILFFVLIAHNSMKIYSIETVLQMIIVFIPIFIIVYLVVFNGLSEINK